MSDAETRKQIEALKKEVAALSKAREASAARPEPEPESESVDVEVEVAVEGEATASSAAPTGDFRDQIEELVETLGEELRDNPVVTGLAIFVAGLLVGRLLR